MNIFTRILSIIFFLTICDFSVFAQENNQSCWEQKKQKFKAEKVAYISSVMNFTVEEAQKFWPIYNKYDALFDEICNQRRALFDPRSVDINSLSSAQCDNILNSSFTLDEKELQAKRNYYNELKVHFKSDFILKYYHSEHDFRRKVFRDNKSCSGSFGKTYKNE